MVSLRSTYPKGSWYGALASRSAIPICAWSWQAPLPELKRRVARHRAAYSFPTGGSRKGASLSPHRFNSGLLESWSGQVSEASRALWAMMQPQSTHIRASASPLLVAR